MPCYVSAPSALFAFPDCLIVAGGGGDGRWVRESEEGRPSRDAHLHLQSAGLGNGANRFEIAEGGGRDLAADGRSGRMIGGE